MTDELKCKINCFLYSVSNRGKFNVSKQHNVKIKAVICGEQNELKRRGDLVLTEMLGH